MTDLELWKAIVRATHGIAIQDIPKSLAKVRELLADPQEPARADKSVRNRMFRGGLDRGSEDGAA